MGLGLAICHRMAGLLGAGLSVQSTPGAGSTFGFEIHAPSALDAQTEEVLIGPGDARPEGGRGHGRRPARADHPRDAASGATRVGAIGRAAVIGQNVKRTRP